MGKREKPSPFSCKNYMKRQKENIKIQIKEINKNKSKNFRFNFLQKNEY